VLRIYARVNSDTEKNTGGRILPKTSDTPDKHENG